MSLGNDELVLKETTAARFDFTMTHVCDRARSDKEKSSNMFNKQLKATDDCCSMSRASAECKCLNHRCKTNGWTKMKRLKSRKERSNTRGLVKEHFKPKSHLQHCHHQRSKDRAQIHNCCLHGHQCPSRRDAPFPDVVPAVHKPSIITDSRLIGHQGLFGHEVKSIDIERLLSEQRKQETSEQQVQKRSNAASQPSSAFLTPSPLSFNGLLRGDAAEDVKFENKPHTATNARDDCQEKENSSDLTPWQRPDRSPGSFKSILSSQQPTPTVDREDVKTPKTKIKDHMSTNLECTRKNQEFPVSQTQACSLCPSPVSSEPLNSPTVYTLSSQPRRQDPDGVSKSVSTLEAGLCDSLRFPLLRRRSLVSESKRALLKVLQKRHGPQLRENLLLLQQHLEDAKKVQEQDPTVIDEPLPTDEFRTAFEAKTDIQSQFETHKASEGWGFNWKSNPQLHNNLKHTAEWSTSPAKTSGNLLGEIFKPTLSPQYYMDFEPSEATASDQLFARSSLSRENQALPFQHWEDQHNRPKVRETVMFGSLENSFMSFNREGEGSQYEENNFQPFLRPHVKLSDQLLAGPLHLSPEQYPVETDRYLFSPPSKVQAPHPLQGNCFHPFTQFSHFQSACSPLRPHCTDVAHHSRSHVHEKEPAHPFSTFSSPEQWHFRPMWLF
ncbi:uncharacterized protein V6R79_025227 [Siganus canaliculatus]